jgi:hypothetical protein
MGVLLIVLIYILYKVISEKGKVVTKKIDMVTNNGATLVPMKNLREPTSIRYYISFWIYVKKLENEKIILEIKSNSKEFLKIKLSSDLTLKYDILLATDSTVTSNNIIMNNFPLQKWVYVILSIDNNVADMYIDGKMVRSQKLTKNSEPIAKDANINPGTMDAYLAKVEREPLPMDPTMAWNKYMEGNGGNYFSKMFSNYGATFTLKKNDLDVRQFNLF